MLTPLLFVGFWWAIIGHWKPVLTRNAWRHIRCIIPKKKPKTMSNNIWMWNLQSESLSFNSLHSVFCSLSPRILVYDIVLDQEEFNWNPPTFTLNPPSSPSFFPSSSEEDEGRPVSIRMIGCMWLLSVRASQGGRARLGLAPPHRSS